ncbi:MAG: hypothetical protein ACM3PY_16430 [Omnitrophica WOR_2 bacterium]
MDYLSDHDQPSIVLSIGQWFTRLILAVAVLVFLVAPFRAISWARLPFPGFVVEQTLVVTNIGGNRWSGRAAGLEYPEKVIAIEQQPVSTPADYLAAISTKAVGMRVTVETIQPDGTQRSHPDILLTSFPLADLIMLFWLPYGIGLVYLALGLWIYSLRKNTPAGRAFTDFCACVAIVTALTFDLSTTHLGAAVWTVVLTLVGSDLISLALLFPEEVRPIRRRTWLHLIFFLTSIGLSAWGLLVLHDTTRPWAYVDVWKGIYAYSALSMVVFLAMQIYRMATNPPGLIRQQARIILWGSLMAFTPLVIWFTLPQLINIAIPWNPTLFLPLLLIFPISIGLAILRYRLWDIDLIIRRTLVYTILTVFLAAFYLVIVFASGMVMRNFTTQSQLALVLSTLAVVAMATPLRARVQNIIDRRFYRQKYDAEKTLESFSESLREDVDLESLSYRILRVVQETMQPEHTILWLSKIDENLSHQ